MWWRLPKRLKATSLPQGRSISAPRRNREREYISRNLGNPAPAGLPIFGDQGRLLGVTGALYDATAAGQRSPEGIVDIFVMLPN